MFYVYVIKNDKNRNYVGHTNNIERRIHEHNGGLSPYTKNRGPWRLFYLEEYFTRSEAMKREAFFKSGIGRRYLKEKEVEKELELVEQHYRDDG